MLSDQAILRHIERQPHHSAGYKQLIRELNLRGEDRRQLPARLEALVKSGRLIETGRDRYTLAEHAAARQNLVAGRLTMHRDGYGFVIPNAGQRGVARSSQGLAGAGQISGDIFIPPPAIGSAMHGDQVLVELTRKRPGAPDDGRSEGRILRVLTRGNPTFVGTFHYASRQNYVIPMDEKVTQQVIIPRGLEWPGDGDGTLPRPGQEKARTGHPGNEPTVDGEVSPNRRAIARKPETGQEEHRVPRSSLPLARTGQSAVSDTSPVPQVRVRPLDANLGKRTPHPGAPLKPGLLEWETNPDKRRRRKDVDRVLGNEARRTDWDDLEGVVVEVEITEWPSPTENPRGRVIEILGYEDDFGVDVEIVIRKFHLPHHFPVEVLQEAQTFEPIIPAGQLRHRRDFRALPIVTIDGETARDFDDAVTVRRMSNGNFELQVHIADVAHYVREESSIDLEARLRGTSVYFPDRAVPMLPIELSTDLCSLRPQVDRMVLSCVMEIDHQGEVIGYTLSEGVIRSVERMTYTNVNLILEGDTALRKHYSRLIDVFELMRELAMILNRKRVRRGSIDFDLPEPVIEFDEHGLMTSITRSERNIANRIIEEFMLSANECVASYLENKGVPSLYRIHEKPDPKRVMDFETIAARFGYSLGVGPIPVKRVQFKAERRDRYGTGQRAKTLEIPEDIHITPRMYQKLTQKVAGKPEERILSYLMLRSLKQARYSEKNDGHFALAAPTYTHFTSPIRRYPDLIVHRILKDVLRDSADREEHGVPIGVGESAHSESPSPWSKRKGDTSSPGEPLSPYEKPHSSKGSLSGAPAVMGYQDSSRAEGRSARSHNEPEGRHKRSPGREPWVSERPADRVPSGTAPAPIPEPELHDIAEESSQSERRADEAERELMEWKKMKFMEDRLGDEFDGLIVSVTKFGLFVKLNDMFIEGLVPLSSLADDRFVYHENTRQIIGQRSRKTYSLGDPIRVLVDRIDRSQRRIQFAIVEERPQRGKRHRRS